MPSIGAASVTVEIIPRSRRSIRAWTSGLIRGVEGTMQKLRASIRSFSVVLCLVAVTVPDAFAAAPIITRQTPVSSRPMRLTPSISVVQSGSRLNGLIAKDLPNPQRSPNDPNDRPCR